MATRTRLQMLSYVIRTFKRTDKDTEIYEHLDDTILDISGRHSFQFYHTQSTVPLVAEQEDYPNPTTMLHFHHPVRLLDGSATNDEGHPLERLTKSQYNYWEPNPNRTNPATGRPWGYTVYGNEILLTRIPGAAEVTAGLLLELDWGVIPTLPTADGDDSHKFGLTWDETVKWGILCRLYADLEMEAESEKWGKLYEIGKPINVGGRTGEEAFMGGIANMIALDMQQTEMPQHMVNNAL